MKKIIFVLALTAGVLTSCDPLKDEGTFEVNNTTSETLLQGASFSQYNAIKNEDGTVTYEPSADGNYIKFAVPAVPSVDIYYIKKDGSEGLLSYGTNSGMFNFKPTRGSDPQQNIYFRFVNADLKEIVASKEFTLQVAQELSAGDKLLCSNTGAKKWFWLPTATNGGAVWGNGGYQAGPVADPAAGYSGAWWGCGVLDGDCPDKFDSQLQHSAAGAITGEEYQGSYMQLNEDGSVEKFSPEGVSLGTGSFQLEGYNDGEAIDDSGNVAYLNTSAGAILWPYQINASGFEPTRFEVAYLSVDQMMLVYASEGTGAWGEATWWAFVNYDDAQGFVTADKWGWYPTEVNGGAVWGNAGYLAGAQEDYNTINGAWWGCGPLDGDCADKFDSQLQHSAAGSITGEEYLTSYMEFNEDGSLVKYGNDGSKLGEGTWEMDMTPDDATFSLGTLTTSAGALLWPYAINMNGFEPTAFNIGYISGNNMILIYAPEGTGGWSECTWWSFCKQ